MSGGSSRAESVACIGVREVVMGEVGDSLRVVTINTRGTGVGHGEYYKINALVDFAEEEGFDIVGVMELHVIRRQDVSLTSVSWTVGIKFSRVLVFFESRYVEGIVDL